MKVVDGRWDWWDWWDRSYHASPTSPRQKLLLTG